MESTIWDNLEKSLANQALRRPSNLVDIVWLKINRRLKEKEREAQSWPLPSCHRYQYVAAALILALIIPYLTLPRMPSSTPSPKEISEELGFNVFIQDPIEEIALFTSKD